MAITHNGDHTVSIRERGEQIERRDPLADRALTEPARSRLAMDHPARPDILAAHDRALAADEPGYLDPDSGLFVLTAAYLAARGYCCTRGCRHCPFIVDPADKTTGRD